MFCLYHILNTCYFNVMAIANQKDDQMLIEKISILLLFCVNKLNVYPKSFRRLFKFEYLVK